MPAEPDHDHDHTRKPGISGLARLDFSDDSNDPLLLTTHGDPVETWREGYPYDTRMTRKEYEASKRALQIELLKLQSWVKATGQKVVLLFEGRDAAGKGGTIQIRYYDGTTNRYRTVTGYVGEDGIEAGQTYALDDQHKFIGATV